MNIVEMFNFGTGCNGCCEECSRSKRGKIEKETEMSVPISEKSLSPASDHDLSKRPSLNCKN